MRRCIILVNKIKDAINFMLKSDGKRAKIIVAMGLVAIVLIAFSSFFQSNDNKTTEDETSFDYSQYSDETKKQLTNIVSSIDGVGDCEVMITFEYSSENVYATDSENKNDENSQSNKDEYVLYDSQSGALLIKEKYPTVQGVSVVCSGGDNVEVREAVINTVTSLFNISANRVSVSKIKSKG